MRIDFQFVHNLDAQIKQDGAGGLKQLSQAERKTLQQALAHLPADRDVEIPDEIANKIQHPSDYKASFWNSIGKFFQRHFSSDFVGTDALSEQIDHIVNPSIPTDLPPDFVVDEEIFADETLEETLLEEPKNDNFIDTMAERRRKLIDEEEEEAKEIEKPITLPERGGLLSQIQAGKKLNPVVKNPETEAPAKNSLTDSLSKQFDAKFKQEEQTEDNFDVDDQWK